MESTRSDTSVYKHGGRFSVAPSNGTPYNGIYHCRLSNSGASPRDFREILSEKLITSVPWKELFPIRIGLAKLGSGKEPSNRAKTSTGLCLCEDSAGMFHPGITTGFWRPQRLIELTRSPGCLMALGGHKLPIVDQRRWGTLGSANIPKGLTYLHAHVYSLPLIEMLNIFTGIGGCTSDGCTSDLVDFDLMNLSEVDPSWNHPELAALL